MKKEKLQNQIIIYRSKTGAIELKSDVKNDTIWATQEQIAEIFDIERSVITKHIRNILKDKELEFDSVCAKFARTASDGKTYQVQFYSLDVILAVGYRTNSSRAIVFRQWATKILRKHVTKGYTINRSRIKRNYLEFMKAVENLKIILPSGGKVDQENILELVSVFSATWFSLDAFDKDELATSGSTKRDVKFTAEQLSKVLVNFKTILLKKGEVSDYLELKETRGMLMV